MDNDKIPYIAFEAEMARHERTIKRLLISLVATKREIQRLADKMESM